MANNKKPRKKYRPKEAKNLPVTYRFDAESELHLQLLPHTALSKFKTGESVDEDWHTMASRLNLGSALASQVYGGGEPQIAMNDALEALRSVWVRHETTGKWGTTGEEYNLIASGLTLCDEMQRDCTRRELRASMRYVIENAAVNRRGLTTKDLMARSVI